MLRRSSSYWGQKVLEIGKTYKLKDGSGTGAVVGIRYLVKLDRPRHAGNGCVNTYTPEGTYTGCIAFESPPLVLEGDKPGYVEEEFKL